MISFFREYLKRLQNKNFEVLNESLDYSKSLKYHLNKNIPLINNIYRYGSNKFFELFKETRKLLKNNNIILYNEDDIELLKTDLGEFGYFENNLVPLDFPFLEEQSKKLNKPFRTPNGPKKFAVYVKNEKGNVIKVTFGDPNSRVKNNNKERAKSFQARHNCKDKKDKTTPGYRSCNLGRYSKLLGLSSSNPW